ncbi:MAG: hypothetical protein MJZ54_01450 [Bacteroidaceae bacterium]|nr:hypothetical protein [Bacteroidaceae bacterium]
MMRIDDMRWVNFGQQTTDNGRRTADNGQQTTDNGQQTTVLNDSSFFNLLPVLFPSLSERGGRAPKVALTG